MLRAFFGSLAALVVIHPVHAKNEPVVLNPAQPWSVDFGDDSCVLARTFGPEDNRHALLFRQWSPSKGVSFTATGPAFRKFRSTRTTYVAFRTGAKEKELQPFIGDTAAFGRAVIYASFVVDPDYVYEERSQEKEGPLEEGLAQLDIGDAARVEFISFRQGERTVQFNLDALPSAFEVMNNCTQGLLEEWGVHLEKHQTATRRVRLENVKAIAREVASNYPRAAVRNGEQAILRARVMVDETGKATDCVISNVTQTEKLDSPACRPLMRGKFIPALDANGEPFPSFYWTIITYRMD